MKKLEQLDHRRRFRIYTPVTESGDPIYVHAKIMIVDDVILRVGSSNMNNRSLGLDSECDVTIEAGATNATNRRTIAAIRTRLMAEHPGVETEAIVGRPEAHTSELQSLMRISYVVFCLKKTNYILDNMHSDYAVHYT